MNESFNKDQKSNPSIINQLKATTIDFFLDNKKSEVLKLQKLQQIGFLQMRIVFALRV